MSEHSTRQLASEGAKAPSGDLEGTDQLPNKAFVDAQPPEQFELNQDEFEDHNVDRFFYEFDMEEELRQLEMMKELERRRAWARRHQLSEGGEDGGEAQEEEEEEDTSTTPKCANDVYQNAESELPAPWGHFDWRVDIAEYVFENKQDKQGEEPLSPGRAAHVDQALFQTFPGIRNYCEEHPEEYLASLNSDLGTEA